MPETASTDLPRKAETLAAYLRRRVRSEGDLYIKSRFVAEDIDLSAKEVGSYMSRVGDQTDLTVEPWAYANGTTWHVTDKDS
jgi:hypothetical protein